MLGILNETTLHEDAYSKFPTKNHHEELNVEGTKNAYSIYRASSQINLSSQSQKRQTHTFTNAYTTPRTENETGYDTFDTPKILSKHGERDPRGPP
jgi:hypothetical protein